MKPLWEPYSGQDGPRSPGRLLLSQFLESFYEQHWMEDAADIREAFAKPGSDGASILASTIDFLGSLVADNIVAAALRPIGGGEPLPMKAALWEIDDYEVRFRSSALSLNDWLNPSATTTHWIFVSEADVTKFFDSWLNNTFNEPVVFDAPQVTAPGDLKEMASFGGAEPRAATVLRLPAVMARTGLSRSTIYERIAAGTFPPQVRLGPRAAGWYEDEVDRWVRSRRQMSALGR